MGCQAPGLPRGGVVHATLPSGRILSFVDVPVVEAEDDDLVASASESLVG